MRGWRGARAVPVERYADRRAAAEVLATAVQEALAGTPGADVVVLGLPRGGVPVAAAVAAALGADLDVLVVRKLGVPWQPELAMGAVAGVADRVETVRNERVLSGLAVRPDLFEQVREGEVAELARQEARYRAGRPPAPVAGRTAVVVDDGLATGATVRAAVAALRSQSPARVVVAVPVGSAAACTALEEVADLVVCPWTPDPFTAVGQAYEDFSPTPDDEVRRLLRLPGASDSAADSPADSPGDSAGDTGEEPG